MKIFLTGATGFIGSKLSEHLMKKHNLICFVRKLSDISNLKGCEIVYGDLKDYSSIKGIEDADLVIHAAALYKIIDFNLEEMYETNIEGTKNILDLCEEYNKPLIYFSTTAVLKEDGNLKENVSTDYEKTKLDAHALVLDYADKIPVTIICPSVVFGPGDQSILGSYLKQYLEGDLKYIACPKAKLSFVYVDDVVKAIDILIEKRFVGQYIVSGYSMRLIDFFDLCEEITGIKRTRITIPCTAAKFLSLFTGQKKVVDFISDQGYFQSLDLKNMGWQPTRIDIALRNTLESLGETAPRP